MVGRRTFSKGSSTNSAKIVRGKHAELCQGSTTTDDVRTTTATQDRQSLQSNMLKSSESAARHAPHESSVPAADQQPSVLVMPNDPKGLSSSSGSLSDDIDSRSNAKKKKKKGEQDEPAMEKVEERKAFSISTQLYRFGEHLAMYNRMYQETYPHLLCNNCKFYMETEHNGVGCLDLLFTAFCDFMKMEKVKTLSAEGGGERIFCWLGKRKATEVLPILRPEHHFVNRLPLDIYLKDKQSLALTLRDNTLYKGIQFPAHLCLHSMTKIPCQLLCPHQYDRHSMEPCEEPNCLERISNEARNELGIEKLHQGRFCPCFLSKIFVPETKVFASSLQQNVFIEDVSRTAPDARWVVKPSYMRSGRGVRILSSAEQLRTFLKVKTSSRFMWGQNYVVQRYIQNPLLTNQGQKFDIRMFLLIIVTRFKRVLGFLHPGFVRKVPDPYAPLKKGDKFRARQHLAGTRVWRTYGPVKQEPSQPPVSGNNLDDSEDAANPALQTQNNAKKKKKRQPSVQLDASEPIHQIGFYANDFSKDECEEYNYAVRHGCLKDNQQNLPLIMPSTKVPLLVPERQKPAKAGDRRSGAVSPASVEPSASPTEKGISSGGKAAVISATATESVEGRGSSTNAPPNQDPWAHLSANADFLRSLRSMVSNVCRSVLDQIKEKANCYQIFSLDVCVDNEGKPWLLEVNPSIVTESVNWDSRTIREVIPAVLVESLALVCECTRKGLNFLALRTPPEFTAKPEDLVFRQNFLWLYSTPDNMCDMFELTQQKYAIEKQFKLDLTSRGISYMPVDYYPEKNQKLVKTADSDAAKKAAELGQNRCTYRFPSPVANIPVLEEDVSFSLRYTRNTMDAIKRETRVRRQEKKVAKQRVESEEARYDAYCSNKQRPKSMLKERFILQ